MFTASPLAHFSDSPGAIYPALLRLRARDWIEPVRGECRSRRGRRSFRVTIRGQRVFLAWLRTGPTRAEIERDMDALILRFSFMSEALPRSEILRFLRLLNAVLEDYVVELEQFLKTAGPHLPISGQLAFESGIEGFRGYVRWVKRAAARLRTGPAAARRRR
jgi:DNA-binding PadR family transcriptional regulator